PVDPNRSPGYNGAHNITIAYHATGQVNTVAETVTGPGTSTWTFQYFTGTSGLHDTRATHGIVPPGARTVPANSGYTTISAPRGGTGKVYYDDLGQLLESVDPLGNYVEGSYNREGQLLWREDQDGNPTDN